jgi:GNAT superfamily N-acetyltransferase
MKFEVRAARAADIGAMHRVRNAVRENRLATTTRISEISYRPYIAAGTAWVAETSDGIVGFAAIDAPAASVWALFIDPGAEGAGIGRALHQTMLDWAAANGLRRLSLSTEHGSRAAQFYTRAGWTKRSVTSDGEVHFEKTLQS